MSIRYALLGLLRDRPATGYDLTQRFAEGIGRYAWSAKHSQIYPELRKLTDEGLIEVVEEGSRGKRVYALTGPGHTELRGWLLRGPEPGTVRNPVLLWMFLVGRLDPADATRALEGVEKHAVDMLAELTETYESLTADGEDSPAGAYAAKFGVFSYESVRDWARWALAEQRKRQE
ncbi:DNA-binding PadR family transcriptional regulator [Nocardia transvalensis]|uniref:DNA-binding PadR family transcriptional regulator n=1 Tax=Nocardia transvalensis TaxID=37333 RepID=A0A7W9PMM4_9NOCA|nr:PadR family transcriptional regulator [Nocardia transvalensis]MBB5918293.1 DNA-binding PadR family transcriptional regulator [Nocardia transvalensis]